MNDLNQEPQEEKPKRKYKSGRVARRPMLRKRERKIKPTSEELRKRKAKRKKYKTPMVTYQIQRRKKTKDNAKKLVLRPSEKDNNALKYIHFVNTYFTRKYDITQQDLTLALYLYEDRPFKATEFMSNVKLLFGKTKGEFKRFLRKGYIKAITAKLYAPKSPTGKYATTDSYKLTLQFHNVLTKYYELLVQFQELDKGLVCREYNTEEINALIYRLQKEVKAIEAGKIKRPEILKKEDLKINND